MSQQDIEAMKRNIEKQLDEYAAAINAAAKWHQEWKARQPKGFHVNYSCIYYRAHRVFDNYVRSGCPRSKAIHECDGNPFCCPMDILFDTPFGNLRMNDKRSHFLSLGY